MKPLQQCLPIAGCGKFLLVSKFPRNRKKRIYDSLCMECMTKIKAINRAEVKKIDTLVPKVRILPIIPWPGSKRRVITGMFGYNG